MGWVPDSRKDQGALYVDGVFTDELVVLTEGKKYSYVVDVGKNMKGETATLMIVPASVFAGSKPPSVPKFLGGSVCDWESGVVQPDGKVTLNFEWNSKMAEASIELRLIVLILDFRGGLACSK